MRQLDVETTAQWSRPLAAALLRVLHRRRVNPTQGCAVAELPLIVLTPTIDSAGAPAYPNARMMRPDSEPNDHSGIGAGLATNNARNTKPATIPRPQLHRRFVAKAEHPTVEPCKACEAVSDSDLTRAPIRRGHDSIRRRSAYQARKISPAADASIQLHTTGKIMPKPD